MPAVSSHRRSYTLGAHYHLVLGILFAAAALGGELLKPFAVMATIDAARSLNLIRMLACSVVAIVCISYSLAAELSLSATLRGDQAAQRGVLAEQIVQAKSDRDRAFRELTALETVPGIGVLQAEIHRLRSITGAECDADPRSVQFGPISQRICPKVSELHAQLARAERKARLEATVERSAAILSAASADGKVVGHASPLAASLSAYAAAAGYRWTTESIAPWLALLVPLLLEVGSSFGLIVARGLGKKQPVSRVPNDLWDSVATPLRDTDHAPGLSVVPVSHGAKPVTFLPAVSQPSCVGQGAETSGTPLRLALLAHIRQAGGTLQTDQRGLARLLEVSKSELHRALHSLAEEGRILLSTDRRTGTRIELVSA